MISEKDHLVALIRQLETELHPAAGGLPDDVFFFVSRVTPLVNVDLLIQDESRQTLLTWRHDRFYGPGWHVPGGVIRYKESAGARIHAVAKRELGVSVDVDAYPILVHEHIDSGRDDRGHMISLLYKCRLTSALDCERRYVPEAPAPDQWKWHPKCPEDLIPEQLAYATFMS